MSELTVDEANEQLSSLGKLVDDLSEAEERSIATEQWTDTERACLGRGQALITRAANELDKLYFDIHERILS